MYTATITDYSTPVGTMSFPAYPSKLSSPAGSQTAGRSGMLWEVCSGCSAASHASSKYRKHQKVCPKSSFWTPQTKTLLWLCFPEQQLDLICSRPILVQRQADGWARLGGYRGNILPLLGCNWYPTLSAHCQQSQWSDVSLLISKPSPKPVQRHNVRNWLMTPSSIIAIAEHL